jgi:peptidyl-prolyl cis-trans isomerase C
MGCGPSSETVAKVGDWPISRQELDAYLELKKIPKTDEARVAKALSTLAERKALARAIEKQGRVDQTKLAVEVDDLRNEILISRHFDALLKEQVDDSAVSAYYEAHGDDYAETQAKVAHILVRTKRKMGESERAAKRTKLQEAHGKLLEGADFAEVAKEYSEDAMTSTKGGELGWVKKGGVDPAFSDKVFSMTKGQVSEPFETAFGYHVVKILEEPRTEKRPLTAVQGEIRQTLRAATKKAEMERLSQAVGFEILLKAPSKKEGR